MPSPQEVPTVSLYKKVNKHEILKKKLENLRRLLKKKRAVIRSLKNKKNDKVDKNYVQQFFNKTLFSSVNSKAIMTMQVLHKNRRPWTKAEKNLALSLYYKSPSAYIYMRKNGIILPSESTVRRWLRSILYVPGFVKEYLNQIKLKVSSMKESDKKCSVLFDEVAIMKHIEYNKSLDLIEGFEDMGVLGRFPKYAKHALVIMVRGLYSNWKFPLCYFLTSNGVKGNDLCILIKSSIKEIGDIGLLPTALVCDQGTQNQKLFSLLGGTDSNPTTKIDNQILHLIYDVPHLFKSVRNNLLNGDIQINQKKIVFQDIVQTYEIDTKNSKARSMCKISPIHLNPNPFQKMSCKLALQIFSNSVSSAIKTSIHTGQLKSKSANDTADFLLELNNTFDACNSQNLYDKNPNRRPMSSHNKHIFENINKTISTFQNAKKICHKNNKISVPPCFTGIVWSLNAIKQLYELERSTAENTFPSNEKTFFLLTNRLNQDPLENMFSIMRQKNGYTRNPTAKIFRTCFASICSFSLMKVSEKCNCEADQDEFLTIDVLSNIEVDVNNDTNENISDQEIENETIDTSSDEHSSSTCSTLPTEIKPKVTTLEECSIIYFAGYLAKRTIEHFNCTNCEKNLLTHDVINEPNKLLITFKAFEHLNNTYSKGLKKPSSLQILICNTGLNVFSKMFAVIKSEKEIVKRMLKVVVLKLNKQIKHFDDSTCKDHYEFIVQLLLITRIYKECKWSKEDGSNKLLNKLPAKLRILSNK